MKTNLERRKDRARIKLTARIDADVIEGVDKKAEIDNANRSYTVENLLRERLEQLKIL